MKKNIKLLLFVVCIVLIIFILLNIVSNEKLYNDSNSNQYKAVSNDILLMLVNYQNKIPDDYEPLLTEYNGYKISNYIKKDLIEMINDAKKEGYIIEISSAYRTYEEQKEIYDDKYSSYINIGMKKEDSKYLTEKEVAIPGYSEHETGLALDLTILGDSDYKEKTWNYLKENSYKYGFINRYLEEKTNITKIKYEPWHFRYVGKEFAKDIYTNQMCLEEYLENK